MNTIINTLRENGHQAYFVGGCVRDTLMGVTPKDWDIATSATPDQVMALFPDCVPVGAKFGVVLVKDGAGWEHEVATFRQESDHVGHDCSVVWSTLTADASRRDFTINAMYMDEYGIIDYFGGQNDIETNTLRTVGRAERRFAEDPLRMLRAIRFAAKYNMVLSDEILNAMNGALLSTISAERIRDEFLKILAVGGLRLCFSTGLLAHFLPEIAQLDEVAQDNRHPEGNVFDHTVLVVDAMRSYSTNTVDLMAALLHDVGKFDTFMFWPDTGKISFINHEDSELPEKILRRLKFSNDEIDSITWLVQNHMRMHKFFEMKKAKRHMLMRHKDWENLRLLHRADCIGGLKGTEEANKILTYCATVVLQEPKALCDRLVTGDDLIALGHKPGKEMGQLLARLEEAQREGEFTTKEEGLKYLTDRQIICYSPTCDNQERDNYVYS